MLHTVFERLDLLYILHIQTLLQHIEYENAELKEKHE